MRRILALHATALLLTAGLAAGQLRTHPGGSLATAEWVEFEVVSVERDSWTVLAKDLEGGDTIRFRMPPQSFQGQRFTADLTGADRGRPIDVRGQADASLDKMVLEAPLGGTTAPGAGSSPRTPPRRMPTNPAGMTPPGESGGGLGSRYGSGPTQYTVSSVDPKTWVVTARGPGGESIQLEVDPAAFAGYRFKAPVRGLRRGQGFALLALNQKPIAACCTLVSGPGGP